MSRAQRAYVDNLRSSAACAAHERGGRAYIGTIPPADRLWGT